MDVRINPGNKFSGYIQIIIHLNIRQYAGSLFSCTFCVVFQNFYAILQKILYINTKSKILTAGLNVLPLGYTSVTLRYPPLLASLRIYEFI